MAWTQRHHLLRLFTAEAVVWPLWAAGLVFERGTHGSPRPLANFVEVAAADTERGGHL